MLPLSDGELNTQTDSVGNHHLGQHGNQSVSEHGPETSLFTDGEVVLVSDVVHTEEQRRRADAAEARADEAEAELAELKKKYSLS